MGFMNLTQYVGYKIRQYRQAKNISQQELADEAGLQQSDIYRLEYGKRRFNSDQLEKISNALGVSVIKFFPPDIEDKNENEKLFNIISQVPPEIKDELIDFLLALGAEVDFKKLRKALDFINQLN